MAIACGAKGVKPKKKAAPKPKKTTKKSSK